VHGAVPVWVEHATADDVRNGETKAIGFLIGQCMKLSKGQGNPQLFQELIKKQLGA
jgi:aspartyl-tRNA(Asn)/glutamyl-tRNA(Gln) amidotransferase subunit B